MKPFDDKDLNGFNFVRFLMRYSVMSNHVPINEEKLPVLFLAITFVVVTVLLIAGLMRLSQNFSDILGYLMTGLGLGGVISIGGVVMAWLKEKNKPKS